MALVEQLGDDSWSVLYAACCHMALVLPLCIYITFFNFILRLYIPFLYFSLPGIDKLDGMVDDTSTS